MSAAAAPDARRRMLAKVHLARKQLALDEGTYRALLARVTGRESAAELDGAALDRVLAEFRRLGWRAKARRDPSPKPWVRKIYGLWAAMAPQLDEPSAAALRSFVRRQTRGKLHPEGVSAPEFLDPKQAARVIEGLKAWGRRIGADIWEDGR